MPHKTGGAYNQKFALNKLGVFFVSGHLCAKALPFIAPMEVCTLEFGEDSAYQDHKIL